MKIPRIDEMRANLDNEFYNQVRYDSVFDPTSDIFSILWRLWTDPKETCRSTIYVLIKKELIWK